MGSGIRGIKSKQGYFVKELMQPYSTSEGRG